MAVNVRLQEDLHRRLPFPNYTRLLFKGWYILSAKEHPFSFDPCNFSVKACTVRVRVMALSTPPCSWQLSSCSKSFVLFFFWSRKNLALLPRKQRGLPGPVLQHLCSNISAAPQDTSCTSVLASGMQAPRGVRHTNSSSVSEHIQIFLALFPKRLENIIQVTELDWTLVSSFSNRKQARGLPENTQRRALRK